MRVETPILDPGSIGGLEILNFILKYFTKIAISEAGFGPVAPFGFGGGLFGNIMGNMASVHPSSHHTFI